MVETPCRYRRCGMQSIVWSPNGRWEGTRRSPSPSIRKPGGRQGVGWYPLRIFRCLQWRTSVG